MNAISTLIRKYNNAELASVEFDYTDTLEQHELTVDSTLVTFYIRKDLNTVMVRHTNKATTLVFAVMTVEKARELYRLVKNSIEASKRNRR